MHGDGPSLPHAEQTIAEVLKAAGYATAMAGKWHLGNGDANHPSTHGFDEALTVPWTTDMACYEPWPCRYDHATLEHGTLSVGNAQMRAEFVATLASMCRIGTMPQAGLPLPQHWAKVKGERDAMEKTFTFGDFTEAAPAAAAGSGADDDEFGSARTQRSSR